MNIPDKILKLARLAQQRDNANEAATAWAQAQHMATLHGLDLDDLLTREAEIQSTPAPREVEGIELRNIVSWGKTVVWKMRLVNGLAKSNGCCCCYSSTRCQAYGQPSDLDTVQYMYDMISREVDRLAKVALETYTGRTSPRSWARSFRIGCVDEINRRLRSQRDVLNDARADVEQARLAASTSENMSALAAATNALVRVCAAEEHTENVRAAIDTFAAETWSDGFQKGRTFAPAGSGYMSGRQAGKSVTLNGSSKVLN